MLKQEEKIKLNELQAKNINELNEDELAQLAYLSIMNI